MTNSLLLRIAVGLCVANTVFGLWSALTVSNARSRLSRAEETIESTSTAVGEIRQRMDSDTAARAVSDKAVGDRLAGIDKQLGEFGKAVEELKKAAAEKTPPKP